MTSINSAYPILSLRGSHPKSVTGDPFGDLESALHQELRCLFLAYQAIVPEFRFLARPPKKRRNQNTAGSEQNPVCPSILPQQYWHVHKQWLNIPHFRAYLLQVARNPNRQATAKDDRVKVPVILAGNLARNGQDTQ